MRSVLLYVAAGSAAGGVCRVLLASMLQQRSASTFPVGTLVVNLTGSIALGFLLRYALAAPGMSLEMRALLGAGFLGGYTTFSTFSYESIALIETGDYGRAASYVIASVVLSLLGTFAGIVLAGMVTSGGKVS